MLQDADPEIRSSGANTLRKMGEHCVWQMYIMQDISLTIGTASFHQHMKVALAQLVKLLKDDDSTVRSSVQRALAIFGKRGGR